MSKIRVHELAKELNKTNKELLDFLKSKEIEVKSHMSSLSDEQIQMVKGAMAGKATKTDGEDAQKKKNIVQVFRPQNSKQNNRPKQNNHKQNQNQNNNNNQGNTKQMNNGQNNPRQNNNQGKRQNNNQGGRYQNNNQNGERKNNNQSGRPNKNFNNSQIAN